MKKIKSRVIQFPMDQYNHFRQVLRPATEARKELMQHLQTLIEEETKRHQQAWDDVARMAGFKNATDMRTQNKQVSVDWVKCQIIIQDAEL